MSIFKQRFQVIFFFGLSIFLALQGGREARGSEPADRTTAPKIGILGEIAIGAASGATLGCALPVAAGGIAGLIGGPLGELYGGAAGLSVCPTGALYGGGIGALIGLGIGVIEEGAAISGERIKSARERRFQGIDDDTAQDPKGSPRSSQAG